jgi:hypothetical protein
LLFHASNFFYVVCRPSRVSHGTEIYLPTFQSSTYSRNSALPPETTLLPLENDSIASELASLHGDDLQNLFPSDLTSVSPIPFTITPNPNHVVLEPIPTNVQDFRDWLVKHFSSALFLDDKPGFLHDLLYDHIDL